MARKQQLDTVQVMLAPNKMIDFDHPHIPYPDVLGSMKLDGNRNFCRAGVNMSRSMKPQGNPHLDEFLSAMNAYAARTKLCFDMEIFDPTATHHGKISGIIAATKNAIRIPDEWKVYIFDAIPLEEWESRQFKTPYARRIEKLFAHVLEMNEIDRSTSFAAQYQDWTPRFVMVQQWPLKTPQEAKLFYEKTMEEADATGAQGIEGIMLRSASAVYAPKRVGTKGAGLLKFKAEHTEDVTIVGVVQMRKMRDGIERTRNAFGRLETPTRNKDNFTTQDNVGALVVKDTKGNEFEVTFAGPCAANPEGWPVERRKREIWEPYRESRRSIIGRCIEIKTFPVGAKTAGRSGRMIRFREDKD